MDEKYKLARHTELWQSGTKLTKRTAAGGLLFAVVVLFNVLIPYAETTEPRAALAQLEAQQARVLEARAGLVARLQNIAAIRATLDAAGWESHRDEVALRLESGPISNPEAEGNAALEALVGEFRETVLVPLGSIEQGPAGEAGGPTDGAFVRLLRNRIDSILEEYRDTDWYTPGSASSDRLNVSLQRLRADAIEAVSTLQSSVEAEMSLAAEQSAALAAQLEDADAAAQSRLDGAIPSWARGLVSVDLMVRIYVIVLLGLATFLVGSGLSTAEHFHAMARAHGLSAEERSDPVLSSLWTLTWRGFGGTAATLMTYLAVLVGFWICLAMGMDAVGADGVLARPTWIPHGVMLLSVATVGAAPFLSRRTPAP